MQIIFFVKFKRRDGIEQNIVNCYPDQPNWIDMSVAVWCHSHSENSYLFSIISMSLF